MALITPSTGARCYFLWGLSDQANPALPVAATFPVPVEPDNLSIDTNMGRKPLETARGTTVVEWDLTEDAATVGGGLSFPLYEALGQSLIFNCAFVDTGGSTHTGTITRPKYITAEIYRAGQSFLHAGLLAKSVKWEVKSKNPTKVTIEFDGIAKPSLIDPSIDPLTYVWPVDQPYVWGHAQPSVTLGGGSTPSPFIDDFELTATFHNEVFYGANGSSFPSLVVPGPVSVAGKFKALFNSAADYNSYITTGQTPGLLEFRVARSNGSSATWTMPSGFYMNHKFTQPIKGAIVEEVDFAAQPINGQASTLLTYTVVNADSSTYAAA